MLIKAEQRYIRMSPRKVRLIADLVREMGSPIRALNYLMHINKRAVVPVEKALKQAVANAKNNAGASEDSLRIKEIVVDQGPYYRRYRAAARGQAHEIKKRTSHVRIVLETIEKKSNDNKIHPAVEEKTIQVKPKKATAKKGENK